jgi:ubiquinone/menaquinone biosynthesis C-methylase UbiE
MTGSEAGKRVIQVPVPKYGVSFIRTMEQNHEVISKWAESAAYWEKHRQVIREMFAPVTQALIDEAGITRGSRVLDIATGPGEPALTIAALVGDEGRVVGTDAVAEMVEAARRESRRQKLRNVNFEVAFAESQPFPVESFDSVVSRFGVMFVASPVDAVREWLRVLKPGGMLAAAVWHYADKNPFHHVVAQILERYVDSAAPPPDAPDAFRFAEPGKLVSIFSEAGVSAPSERLLRFPIRAAIPVEDLLTLRFEMSEKLRTKLAGLSEDKTAELKREVAEAFRAYVSGGEIVFPAEVLIVSGAKA